MSVEKTFGFGNTSPYRSDTFNRNNDLIFGRNGGLEITSIVNSGLNVLIGDIKFIQNGVVVKKVGSSQVTFPVNLPAPFYLTASIPDTKSIDNIAWSFVRRPQDIGNNTVLLAEWDGQEWRPLPIISIKGLIDQRLTAAVAYKNLGFNAGFRFAPNVPFTAYQVTPGQVTDKTGLLVEKNESTIFSALAADSEYDRIDAILWRRWMDNQNRIGRLILRPGQTYSGATIVQNHKTSIGDSLSVNQSPKAINPSDNSMILLWIENYGDNGLLKFTKYAPDRTTELVAPTTIATNVHEFDAVLDKDNNIMIVYIRDGNLYRIKIDNTGVIIVNFASIDGLINPIIRPVIKTDFLGNFYVMFLYTRAPSLYAPYFLKMNTGGTISSPSKLLIDSTSSYSKVHFDINDDFECFVAYANDFNKTIEYQKLNEVGIALTSRETISNDTLYGSAVISGNSRNPIVAVAENNELYITFEQNKGVGKYGLAIYSSEYISRYGHKALLKDFENSTEDILDHRLNLDWGNRGQLLINTAAKLFYYNLLLPFSTSRLLSVFDVNAVPTGQFDHIFDRAGSLIQAFTNKQSGSSNNGAPISGIHFGPSTYGVESVFVGANEVAVPLASLLALSPVPTYGDTFIVDDSTQGNNGTYIIESYRIATIDGNSYRIIRDPSVTFNPESGTGVTSQFKKLTGNAIYFAKQTPTITYNFSEVKAEELDSDILCVAIRKSDNQFLTWYDDSFASVEGNLRGESFLTSAGTINFDKDAAGGTITLSQDLYIREPFRHNFRIPATSITGVSENHVIFTRVPKAIALLKDGDSDGFGTLAVEDISQFSIGQTIFVGDSDSSGTEIVISNIVGNVLYFPVSMADYAIIRGAYVIPAHIVAIVEEQNKGDLRPDSLGFIDTDIYVIAIRANNLVHFRGGTLSLEDGEDGSIGDGPGADTLTFIGSTGDADNAPNYSNNFAGTNGESLKSRISNLDLVTEYEAQNRNLYDFFPVGIAFTWNATLNEITWAGEDWHLLLPDKGAIPGTSHTINTATKTINIGANQVAYIDVNRASSSGDLTPIVVNDNALLLNKDHKDHIVIARRFGDDVSIGLKSQFTLASGQTTGGAPENKLVAGGVWDWNLGTDTLTWSAEAYIQIQGLNNSVNKIAASSAILDADGKVAYVSINQIAPGGFLTIIVGDISSMSSSGSNIILARRIGNNVLVGHNLLEDNAATILDQTFTNNILDRLGLTDNGQLTHNYTSTYFITQSTSHEAAISAFDLKFKQIDDNIGKAQTEYSWLADGSTDTFEVGVSGHGDGTITWSIDNAVNDLILFVDGNKKELHYAGTYPIGDGDTDGEFIKVDSNTVRLKTALIAAAGSGINRLKITVRPYAAGMTNVVAVKDTGVVVEPVLNEIDFEGLGVSVTPVSSGKVKVYIPGGGGSGGGDSYKLFTATNDTGSTIPAKRSIRFLANGRVELCDNAVSGKKNPMAVTVLEIPAGSTVIDSVAIGYLIPGVLSGLGFSFNERVFLGANGELVNEASVPDTPDPDDALIQIGEAYGAGSSTTDLIWNKQEYANF